MNAKAVPDKVIENWINDAQVSHLRFVQALMAEDAKTALIHYHAYLSSMERAFKLKKIV